MARCAVTTLWVWAAGIRSTWRFGVDLATSSSSWALLKWSTRNRPSLNYVVLLMMSVHACVCVRVCVFHRHVNASGTLFQLHESFHWVLSLSILPFIYLCIHSTMQTALKLAWVGFQPVLMGGPDPSGLFSHVWPARSLHPDTFVLFLCSHLVLHIPLLSSLLFTCTIFVLYGLYFLCSVFLFTITIFLPAPLQLL